MTFVISKLVGFFMQPSSVLLAMILGGLALIAFGRKVPGLRLAGVGVAGFLLAGFLPLGSLVLLPLEQRFPPITVAAGDTRFAGIIVLGGGEDGRVSAVRGQLHINEAGERITEAARLGLLLPQARIAFTGGAVFPALGGRPGDGAVGRYWQEMGIAPERILLEGRSRNTYENALFVRDLVKPRPGERWLLLTSAAHMPRSMGIFRKAGFTVTAYPVDFRTTGSVDMGDVSLGLPGGLKRLDDATREWIGLVAYRLLGRTDALFPAP